MTAAGKRFVAAPLLALALCAAGRENGRATAPADAAPITVTLGDSVAFGEQTTRDFAQIVASDTRTQALDLAQEGANLDQVLDEQAPKVPANCAIVLVFVGANDVYPFAHQERDARQFAGSLLALSALIRSRCPRASIVFGTTFLNDRPRYFDAGVAAVNNALKAVPAVRIADLDADPRMHDHAYFNRDFTHPNERGHAVIAHDFEAAMVGPGGVPQAVLSVPIVTLAPPLPSQSVVVSGDAAVRLTVGRCVDSAGAAIATAQLSSPAAQRIVTIAAITPGRCDLPLTDGSHEAADVPVVVSGALTASVPAVHLVLGGPPQQLTIAEPGYRNGFGITFPCADARGLPTMHWVEPKPAGPTFTETLVPDRIGSCVMHVYDFNVPAQVVDVPVVVEPAGP